MRNKKQERNLQEIISRANPQIDVALQALSFQVAHHVRIGDFEFVDTEHNLGQQLNRRANELTRILRRNRDAFLVEKIHQTMHQGLIGIVYVISGFTSL